MTNDDMIKEADSSKEMKDNLMTSVHCIHESSPV